MKTSPELLAAIEAGKARYAAMSPAQRTEMHALQRKSWVIGNMMLDHPEMTREQVEEIYDGVA